MKLFKVTRIYLVPAESKGEALDLVHSPKAMEYLDGEFAKEASPADEHGGWGNTVKTQLAGARK
jgi:hypothetical protein